MILAWGEVHSVIRGVTAFNAQHVQVAVAAHVAQSGGFFDPGIPDDRGLAAFLVDAYPTFDSSIFNDAVLGGVDVNAIGFSRNDDGTGLPLAVSIVHLVQVFLVFKPQDTALSDIANVKIGMQCLTEDERVIRLIAGPEFQVQLGAKSNDEP